MKSMREVNLETYSLSLLTAKEDILNPRSSTNWALFAYDGVMNRLKLADSGVGGLKELASKLQPRRPLYGMCRVGAAQPRIVMILWVGNEVDDYRKAECASHIPAIRAFFKEVHIFLPAHSLEEITEERICAVVYNAAVAPQGPRARAGRRLEDRHTVGTNYKRTNAAAEIHRIQRDSFWAQAEREEEERKKEEQRRAAEDRRQRERERLLQEKKEAMERERRMNEKEQKIKEQRRIQAQMEAEAHKQEKIQWKHQEKEHKEEEIRAIYSRSGSEHKAAEAAALVSQRVENPREFFRQLSSTSLQTTSQSKSPHPVRSPFRQLHRSQTDSIFSFAESPSPTSTSPYRAFSYFPSTPTNQSPTVFTKPTASSLHNGATVSSQSQIQLSLPMEPVTVSDSQFAPRLQTPPLPPPKPEIKSPISAILDSLVFYPPPPAAVELQPDEAEIVEEFPPPPPGFEDPPESAVEELETPEDPLIPSFPPPCAAVPEPPSRPLPALPAAPRMLTDLELEREFAARVSVISTVEEEEEEEEEEREMKNEGKVVVWNDGERRGCEERKGGEEEVEEPDGMIMEKYEREKESHSNILEKGESGKEHDGKFLEESEDNRDGIFISLEKSGSEKDQVGNTVEEFESNEEEDGRRFEECKSEEKQAGYIVEESESEKDKIVEEFESSKEEDGNYFEEYKSETKLDGNTIEKEERERDEFRNNEEKFESDEEARKMMEECESEGNLDGNIMGKGESEEDEIVEEVGKIVEESQSEKVQHAKLMTETEKYSEFIEKQMEGGTDLEQSDNEKVAEEYEQSFLNAFDSEKEQTINNMEVHETEKIQYGNVMEECELENVQNEKDLKKWEEEHESERGVEAERTGDGNIMEKDGSENEQDGEIMEDFESDQIPNSSIILENKREKEQEELDNEKEQDGKSMELFEIENIQYLKMEVGTEDLIIVEGCEEKNESEKEIHKAMKELETDKITHGSIMEENESEILQDWKINKAFDGEKEQDIKNMKEFETEIIQCAKNVEEYAQESEQDRMMVEKCEDDGSLDEHENEQSGEIVGKLTEENGSEEKQDGKIVDVSDNEKAQDKTSMEAFESMQYAKHMEDCGQENEQDEKIEEKCEEENEREMSKSLEKHEEREKDQNWIMIDDDESEKIQYVDIEEHENKEEQEVKSWEVFQTDEIQYVNIMEECGQENQKIVERSQDECKKEQNGEIIQTRDGEEDRRLEEQEVESEKTQNANIMLEHMIENINCKIEERHENEKSLDDQESEKEEDGKMMEDNEGEKAQYGDIMENHESEQEHQKTQQNQYNEGTTTMDGDKAVNVTVLRKDSYTEIIHRDKETASVEEAKSQTENEKEQREESGAETLYSQDAPSFPEFLATKPSQYSDTSIPEIIVNNEQNLPTIQVEFDSSNLRDLELSIDSKSSSGVTSAQPEEEQSPKTETRVTEMSDEVKAIEWSNDLAEGINIEIKTSSPGSETQALIGQSGEGPEPVSQSLEEPETAVDIKQCIIVDPDLTVAMMSDVEGQEAPALKTTDTDSSKYTSDPDRWNENKKHEFLQNCKNVTETPHDMRNEKTTSEK